MQQRRIYVRLTPTEADTLKRIAQTERRHPSDQAAVMLAREVSQVAPAAKEVTANASA